MALSKVQGAQIESPVDIAAVNLTGVSTATDLNATRVNVTGISTLGNVVIGAGGTDLLISATVPTIRLDDNDHNYSGRILHSGASLYLDADYTDVGSGAIRFRVGGTSEKMRLDSAARLGIGTNNPSAGLDVIADASSGYIAEFRQAHASNTAQIIIDSPVDGASRPSYMDYATGGSVKWTTGLAYLDTDRSFHIGTGSGLSNSKLTIKTDGSIGIGTDNPQEDLHIGSNSPYILLDDYDNSRKWKLKGTAWFAIEDTTANAERLRITSAGDVGIGTISPTSNFKLDVNGDLSLGEKDGTDNTYIDQKQNGHLNIINSGTQSDSGKVRINKTNSIGGDTTYFRDFEVYDGKNNLLLIADGSSSNIGINTSANINGRLTIQANDDDELLFQVRSHNGRSAQLKSTASASSTDPFVFQTNNSWGFDVDTIRMLDLSSDYRVGIKSSTPGEELDVRGDVIIGDDDDISPSASGVGQLRIRGNGYKPYIAADATAMYVGHNSSTRKLIFQTNETDRITIDGSTGSVNIGAVTTNVKLYVHDSSGMQQVIMGFQQGTGAYGGLFRCDDGDSTQYACYGYVNTSSSYSSGGVLGYSINSSKYAILGYWSTAAYYGLYSNGLIYSSGGFSSSDERLKDVSSRIEGGVLDDLTSLVPVEYTWKDNTEQGRGLEGVTQIGLIAQEVEVNFPHLVMENFHTRITGINSTSLNEEIGMCKSVEYGKLTCYLLVALTEAYDKIKALEQHVGIAST